MREHSARLLKELSTGESSTASKDFENDVLELIQTIDPAQSQGFDMQAAAEAADVLCNFALVDS